MYVYVCVYMCVFMYLCICVSMHVSMYLCLYVCPYYVCMYAYTLEPKTCRMIEEKYAFLQNTPPQNVITVKKVIFKKHNKETEEVIVFLLCLIFFLLFSSFPQLLQIKIKANMLRYYATLKFRKFKLSFYKINIFLIETTTCIVLQAEQIFSLNI